MVLIVLVLRKTVTHQVVTLAICLLLQTAGVAALGGGHVFIHDYYFIGIAPTGAWLLWELLQLIRGSRWTTAAILIGMSIPVISQCWSDIAPLLATSNSRLRARREGRALWTECSTSRTMAPEFPWDDGVAFRTIQNPYPKLGLCLGVREQSTTSRFGAFQKGESIPPSCRERWSGEQLTLVHCDPT